MKKIIYLITMVRSLPAVLYFGCMKQKMQVIEDIKRWGGNSSLFSLHVLLMDSKLFREVFLTRVSFESKMAYRIIKLCYKPAPDFGIDVLSKKMGGGFIVFHGNSTIVFCQSVGENFLVHQNVTIGRGKMINGCDVPIIGNNVYVGTGAIVIGGIRIGNNVKIGAGAVVTKDVPDNCTVVGNPMKIIQHKNEA